jgi:predicted ribosome quality control (RQC) complex YloA/Tae2 family protein
MHRNYFLFYRQALYLTKMIKGKNIRDCFTHRKNELVLDLEDVFLRIGLFAHMPYILLYDRQGIKTPSAGFFQSLIGQRIEKCETIPFDKSVVIQLDTRALHCYFFGKSPNIYLTNPRGKTIDQFKKEGTIPVLDKKKISLDILHLEEDQFNRIFDVDNACTIKQLLQESLGGFNNLLVNEICYRTDLSGETQATVLSGTQKAMLFTVLQNMAEEIQEDPALVYFQDRQPAHLSLIELNQLTGDSDKERFPDVNQAWKFFTRHMVIEQQRQTLKKQIDHTLSSRIAYLNNTLKRMLDEENLLDKKQEAELKGNLLLTFMGQIDPASKEVSLTNIFSEKQETVIIKLNPAKSVQQNARNYFEKFKHLDIKRDQLRLKKDTFSQERDYWEAVYHRFQSHQSIPELSKLHKTLIAKGLIQAGGSAQKAGKDLAHAFLHYHLDGKWDIYVGKNAKNNELLTFKFARKHDLWFHAQGVPGSHVIIRRDKNEQLPPHTVIERTAAITAYYSEAKHSTKVPVVYTEARYVRKPRNAAPGLVTLSHEKSIMVSPQKPF